MKENVGLIKLNRRQFLVASLAGSALLASELTGFPAVAKGATFELPTLPYPESALTPHLSSRTLSFHYGKHHKAYVDNVNRLVKGTELAELSLRNIVKATAGVSGKVEIFNNAAQAWNHSFYWRSMSPKGSGLPSGELAKKIVAAYGSLENFNKEFTETAATQFGNGWIWLVVDKDALKVVKTGNAFTPVAYGTVPLFAIDVWEHAYYLDYQNRRRDYIAAFPDHLVNWDFAAENLDRHEQPKP